MRPEYVHTSEGHSVETWEEACFISQEWADEARLAAAKRRRRRNWTSIVLMLLFDIILVLIILTLFFDLKLV